MDSNLLTPKKMLKNSDSYMFQAEKYSIQDLKTASRSPSLEETESTQNKISRKTLRGRKEKMPLPKDKLKCEVCLEFSDFSKEDLISCSSCKCLFHKSCYDQFEIYEKTSYKCIRCAYSLKLNKPINDYTCFICGISNGVLSLNTVTKCFYHKICVDLLNEFKGLSEEEICKENIRKWRYKNSCRYCGEKLSKSKAVIKCKNPKCKEYYHIPCAIEKGMIFDLKFMKKYYDVTTNDEIPFNCSNHNKKISFMYKTHVMNNSNDNIYKNNIFKNDFMLCENDVNDGRKTFFDVFEDFEEKNEKNEDEKIKKNYIFKTSKILPIIDEENINEKNDVIFPLENEKDNKKDKELYSKKNNDENMDIDDSFENNNNNVFKLDFEKIKDNDNDIKAENLGFYDGMCDEANYNNFCGINANLPGLNNNNSFLINRQNSFESLPFNI